MKNQRYYETLDVLVKAYLKGELRHWDACGCAVGNMIQSTGIELDYCSKYNHNHIPYWINIVSGINSNRISLSNYKLGMQQLNSLPYTLKEIRVIEKSFENTGLSDDTIDGLQAVEQTIYDMEVWKEDLSVHEASDRINKGTYELILK